MKQSVKIIILAFLSTSKMHAITHSHTFFSVRPNFLTAMPERVALFRDDLINNCACGAGGAFEVVFYGGTTTCEGSLKLADYFLPDSCNGNCMNFKEWNGVGVTSNNTPNNQDLEKNKSAEARNFNIVTINGALDSLANPPDPLLPPFSSSVCFKPEQKKFGVGLVFKNALSFKCDGAVGFWFEGSMPIERIRNRIILKENVIETGNGPDLNSIGLDDSAHVANVIQAFAQKNWKFGRIDNRCCHEKWGIADVELKIGYNTLNTNCFNLNSFAGIILPTGTRVRAKEVFEPIIGNNHHIGVTFGNSIGYVAWRSCNWSLGIFIDGASRFLFSNHQIRSFDLINKQWSRYQEVYRNSEQAFQASRQPENSMNRQTIGTSGINVFTTCFKVHPHFSADLTTAGVFGYKCECLSFQLELGYNLFARQSEQLEIECINFLDNVAIKDITGAGHTNDARNIKQNFIGSRVLFVTPDNAEPSNYLRLSACDIDLESATHPAVISNIFYAAFGVKGEKNCPAFASLGASYEWTHKEINAALNRWLVWGKFGYAF